MSNQKVDISTNEQDSSTFSKLSHFVDKITTIINTITHSASGIILFFLMFLTVADVIGRKFFNSPITGTLDITKVSIAIVVFFSLGYTQLKGEHLEIDFITSKFSKRAESIFLAFLNFIMFIVISLLTWQMFIYGLNTSSSEYSGDFQLIPLNVIIILVAFGALAFALSYLTTTLKYILKVVENK